MTAPNHALTGALIGLTVANPVLALPIAFLSHFVCDAVPHYDPPETDRVTRLGSRRFIREFLIIGTSLCVALVAVLAYAHPAHWFTAAVCAFLAASPDLFWIPRFLAIRRTGIDPPLHNPLLRFHSAIQWKTGPRLLWLELVWFMVASLLLLGHL